MARRRLADKDKPKARHIPSLSERLKSRHHGGGVPAFPEWAEPEVLERMYGADAHYPPTMTRSAVEKLLDLIAAGNHLDTACICSGISSTTYRNWKEKGLNGTQPYADFLNLALEAEAEAEVTVASFLAAEAVLDPRVAQSFLGRRFPERWGRKVEEGISTDAVGTIVVQLAQVADDYQHEASKSES